MDDAAQAFAKLTLNTIDPAGIVTHQGRRIVVTGPLQCDRGETAWLRVTVTQRSTGAVAEGHTQIACTGDIQPWQVQAPAQSNESFQEGAATAVAIARTTDRGAATDAHQWLVAITLVTQ